jgi:hypothetical protein
MYELELTSTQYVLYGALFGLFFGFLFGLIPFFVGRRRQKSGVGSVALVVGIGAGGLLGLIGAVISSVVFTSIILLNRNSQEEPPEYYQNEEFK